jgi:hypothetical protein
MASFIPERLDAKLIRDLTAKALTEAGYPTSPKTLASQATRGGGPPYQLYGRIPLYTWGTSLAWAESRLTPPVHSSAEAEEVRRNDRRLHNGPQIGSQAGHHRDSPGHSPSRGPPPKSIRDA